MEIKFENVSYIYSQGTELQKYGLSDINFKIKSKSFTAVVGHTGSGKSTLIHQINALLKPSKGNIHIGNEFLINQETTGKGLKPLRQKVGMVFQFPENQLFEETVLKDIMFGPLNFGFSKKEAEASAYYWLDQVGLDQSLAEKSPFELSGGQMRRVAIAGVMASHPEVLILDEPTAGLDPVGQKEILSLFKEYQRQGHTVVLVSHDMDIVANYSDEVLVLEEGQLLRQSTPHDLFQEADWLASHSLNQPKVTEFAQRLVAKGIKFDSMPITMAELVKVLAQKFGGKLAKDG
ncbi:energy-coupling factor transporter ATPase [Holzapfeliella floricola]|uniref:Energy-coupling factor transporter ATP-binding protein EcfA2 n=1 Tax=Holzapfeliella floricola DSM 23037 = JCM 16512 TaxID=1423744 RepID=A0A0R2DTK5_9LACO|nr:energy-coupling factor transporter ATPase [Holzapfeliella floricola]KRN04263.1 cobalt transporter ATP-binding subunit [Holzapfeliella floricola DSM 23037 = JCM 16512]